MSTVFFWKSTCTSCRTARGFVRQLGQEVSERNYAKEPLTRGELSAIVAAAPSIAELLNTRHAIAKERGWKDKAPTKAAFIEAALQEPNLLRRPLLLRDGKLVIGKNDAAMKALLA